MRLTEERGRGNGRRMRWGAVLSVGSVRSPVGILVPTKRTRAGFIESRIARLRPGLRIARSRRPDAMRKKRRNGRVTTETCVEDEIVHLRGLDLKGLRARWRSVLQKTSTRSFAPAPAVCHQR